MKVYVAIMRSEDDAWTPKVAVFQDAPTKRDVVLAYMDMCGINSEDYYYFLDTLHIVIEKGEVLC